MKPYMIVGILAMILLSGCATAASAPSSSPSIPVWLERNASAPKRMTSVPSSLGLLAPQVAHYQCIGGYQPAARVQFTALTPPSELAPPFWQFGITCVPPKLKSDLTKGVMLPGVIGIGELPTTKESLLGAIHFLSDANDLKVSSIGKLPIGVGRIHWALGNSGDFNLVWFISGETTYKGVDRTYHRNVLVYLTGRAVSVATLEKVARSMQPLVR